MNNNEDNEEGLLVVCKANYKNLRKKEHCPACGLLHGKDPNQCQHRGENFCKEWMNKRIRQFNLKHGDKPTEEIKFGPPLPMLGNPKTMKEQQLVTKDANVNNEELTNEEEDHSKIGLSHVIASIETMDDDFSYDRSTEIFNDEPINVKDHISNEISKMDALCDDNDNIETFKEDESETFCQFTDDEDFFTALGISQCSSLLGRIINNSDNLILTSYLIERDKALTYAIEDCSMSERIDTMRLLIHFDTGSNAYLVTSTRHLHN